MPEKSMPRLLDWPRLSELVPFSRRRIDELEAADAFPKRIAVGAHRVVWEEPAVLRWLEDRKASGALVPRGALRKQPAKKTTIRARKG